MKNQYFSMVCIESFITFLPIIINYKTFSQKTINFGDWANFRSVRPKKRAQEKEETFDSWPWIDLCSSSTIEPQVFILHQVFHINAENSYLGRVWAKKYKVQIWKVKNGPIPKFIDFCEKVF